MYVIRRRTDNTRTKKRQIDKHTENERFSKKENPEKLSINVTKYRRGNQERRIHRNCK
jgi:hypothetical protein